MHVKQIRYDRKFIFEFATAISSFVFYSHTHTDPFVNPLHSKDNNYLESE